ncbi:MAG: cell wall-binding repeat-containing protein, partial [Coriobacteriia bacterium]|nr:cell wall-binding repeat-containing protein [Coriobacteriia bacterium]
GSNSGSAYVFTRSGTAWTEQAKLTASDGAVSHNFGISVAISSDTAVIGAYYADSYRGSAYVFTRSGTAWTEQAKLTASDGAAFEQFGFSVAVSGDTAVVGAFGDADNGSYSGSAYFTQPPANTAPVATDDGALAATEDTVFVLAAPGVLANDSDAEDDTLSASVLTGPSHGTVDLAASGEITYTPSPDFNGTDTFTYRAFDGIAYSAPATVTIEAAPANDTPSFTGAGDVTVDKDSGPYSATWASAISAGPANESGQALSFQTVSADPSLFSSVPTVASDGTLSFTPAAGVFGSTEVTVTLTDDATAGGPARFVSRTFTIAVVNTAPTENRQFSGSNRYATTIQVSEDCFPEGADAVVIATGEDWPDALGGSALAGVLDAPILLTRSGMLLDEVAAEIERLGATDVWILGGERALSSDVEAALVRMIGQNGVHRIGGENRYKTAALVADQVIALQGGDYDGNAFVATGLEFADALAASPLAANLGWPVYLAEQPVIAGTAVDAMLAAGVNHVVLLGGEAAMPKSTSVTLMSVGLTAERIDGADRYETAAKIAIWGVDEQGMSWAGAGIATGETFPDALAGGPMLGAEGSVMLLVRELTLPTATRTTLTTNRNAIGAVTFLGGVKAISQSVRDDVDAALK